MNSLSWLIKKSKSSIKYLCLLLIIGGSASFLSVFQALCTKYLLDSAISNNSSLIIKWIIILSSVLILNIVLKTINSTLTTYVTEKTKNSLQSDIYSHILNTTWIESSKYHSVDFLTKATNDVSTISNFICNNIPQAFSLVVMLFSSFFTLMTISPYMALIAICIFPLLMLFSKFYGGKLRRFYIELQNKESRYNSFLQESFSNILIIKSFCLEDQKINSLKEMQEDKLQLNIKRSLFTALSNGLLSFSSMIGTFIVLCWGVFKIASGELLFGSITAMLQLFASIQSPIYGLSSLFPQFINSLAASDRLQELEKLPLENKTLLSYQNKNFSTISFKDVSFEYISDKEVLKNINLNVKAGEIIGLIGPSGEGKTTLIRLLLSLIKPQNGQISIDDMPLNESFRNIMSYVPQGNTLFSGTISENLRFGNPKASDEDIFSAIRASYAFDFVCEFKDGINTFIGEKGVGLSEGQAQRLSISRALLRKKPILLLDEATSSLDMETEIRVLNEIRSLDHNPICFIITHRESALNICDKVFRIKNKRCEQL